MYPVYQWLSEMHVIKSFAAKSAVVYWGFSWLIRVIFFFILFVSVLLGDTYLLIFHSIGSGWMKWVWITGGRVVIGKPKSLEKTMSHCHSVHHKSSTDCVGLGLCSEAVSNCLSHGMAAAMLWFVVWAIYLYQQQPTSPPMAGLHSSCWLAIVIIFLWWNSETSFLLYVYYDNLLFTSPHIVSLEDLHNATGLKIVNLC